MLKHVLSLKSSHIVSSSGEGLPDLPDYVIQAGDLLGGFLVCCLPVRPSHPGGLPTVNYQLFFHGLSYLSSGEVDPIAVQQSHEYGDIISA